MIKLYGLRMSNYYSLVKAVMIEKGLEFEEVKAPPTQKEDNLARTPMGKMPSIGVDGHYLSESFAIVNYLERIQPEPALLPEDPLEAAKALELAYHIKLPYRPGVWQERGCRPKCRSSRPTRRPAAIRRAR